MKRTYITPKVRVVALSGDVTILAGSDTGNNNGSDYDKASESSMDEDNNNNNTKAAKWGSVWD